MIHVLLIAAVSSQFASLSVAVWKSHQLTTRNCAFASIYYFAFRCNVHGIATRCD